MNSLPYVCVIQVKHRACSLFCSVVLNWGFGAEEETGEEGAEADDVADEQAHGDNQDGYQRGDEEFDDGHRVILEQGELAQVAGQQEEVYQIDVEGTTTHILHSAAQTGLLREQRLLVAEKREQDDQARQRQQPLKWDGLDGQHVAEGVHPEVDGDAQRQEPLAVEKLLHLAKMLLGEGSQHEEEEKAPLVGADERQRVVGGLVVDCQCGPAHAVQKDAQGKQYP